MDNITIPYLMDRLQLKPKSDDDAYSDQKLKMKIFDPTDFYVFYNKKHKIVRVALNGSIQYAKHHKQVVYIHVDSEYTSYKIKKIVREPGKNPKVHQNIMLRNSMHIYHVDDMEWDENGQQIPGNFYGPFTYTSTAEGFKPFNKDMIKGYITADAGDWVKHSLNLLSNYFTIAQYMEIPHISTE